MERRRLDQIAGLGLAAFSLLVYFVLIPAQIPEDRLGLSSRFFPRLSVVIIGGLGLLLFLKARLSQGRAGQELIFRLSRAEAVRAGLVFGLMIAYLLLLHLIGFIIATPLVLGALLYYSGQRAGRVFWPTIILLPAAVFAFFEYGMKIILPRGVVF